MISSAVRFLMVAAGIVTIGFLAKDAVNFGAAQMMVALLLLTLTAAAFWPSRWIVGVNRTKGSTAEFSQASEMQV